MLSNIISTIITFISFITISVSLIYLYFFVFGRSYAIKQTLGASIYRSSMGLWLLWIVQVVLAIIFTFRDGQFNVSGSILLTLAICIDFLVSLVGVKVFARNSIRGLLNE
ncbi:hypothetical protein KIM322_00230 [Lactobacillus xylocopicola]|uniref:Uncharacterized protein n=1 Tax=Lactobacillus xylocopicola TaxID=2976676 RepID=A0ABM8BEY7_9LACO|nr:hypothetical protein KIM322_00230 [Lactobacillus xylocopicola]